MADENGPCIKVAVSGSKFWRLRHRFAGNARNLSFGRYPEVSFKEARRRRDEARALLRDGVDPGAERKRAKLAAELGAANTFGAVANELMTVGQTALTEAKSLEKSETLGERGCRRAARPDQPVAQRALLASPAACGLP